MHSFSQSVSQSLIHKFIHVMVASDLHPSLSMLTILICFWLNRLFTQPPTKLRRPKQL